MSSPLALSPPNNSANNFFLSSSSALVSFLPVPPPVPEPVSSITTFPGAGASGFLYGFSLSGLNLANALALSANSLF